LIIHAGNSIRNVDRAHGFLVPPQFSQEIFKLSLGEDSLPPLTDNVEISGNSMAFPKDETTPWGTNGTCGWIVRTTMLTRMAAGDGSDALVPHETT
jgi:HK97 family phage major capsid protein